MYRKVAFNRRSLSTRSHESSSSIIRSSSIEKSSTAQFLIRQTHPLSSIP
uniref:Uncharacterized protein n=1 Tax=Arundo donax TaxID=35708 RepID=A0A0A9C6S0_ARUDO